VGDGRAASVAVGSGEGVGLAVAVGDGVGSAVGVSVGTGVDGIAVGVALGVVVGVEVWVGAGGTMAVTVGSGMVVAAPIDVAGSAETGDGTAGAPSPQAARIITKPKQPTNPRSPIELLERFRFRWPVMMSSVQFDEKSLEPPCVLLDSCRKTPVTWHIGGYVPSERSPWRSLDASLQPTPVRDSGLQASLTIHQSPFPCTVHPKRL
jgi:hypothetical protein